MDVKRKLGRPIGGGNPDSTIARYGRLRRRGLCFPCEGSGFVPVSNYHIASDDRITFEVKTLCQLCDGTGRRKR